MEASLQLLELKNYLAQVILSLQDPEKLAQIQEILEEPEIPAEALAGIERGLADVRAGRVISAEEFLAEIGMP